MTFSVRPDFLHWKFGHNLYANFIDAQSIDFQYWYEPKISRNEKYIFRAEVINAARTLDRKRQGKPLALCYSGGVQSEALALVLHDLGIPFDLFFLDLWGLNLPFFQEQAQLLEKTIGKSVNIVRARRSQFFESFAPKLFREFGVEYPTYLALLYLFEQIPESHYIVVGEGGLTKLGNLYASICKNLSLEKNANELHLPFTTASTLFFSWAEKRRREGEYYFYSSTPQLLAAALQDPRWVFSAKGSDARELFYGAFPELKPRPRSNNWENGAYVENRNIRSHLGTIAEEFTNWKKETYSLVNMKGIFR